MVIRAMCVSEERVVHQSHDALAHIAAVVVVPALRHDVVHDLAKVLGPLLGGNILRKVVPPHDNLRPVVTEEVVNSAPRANQEYFLVAERAKQFSNVRVKAGIVLGVA